MSDESELLATLVELRLGLPDAARDDVAPALEDSPESEALAADARRLADVLVRLRDESTLPPASEEAQARFLERVRQNPPPTPSVGLTDLVDLFEGRLSDGEAGSIERRLASDSHAQAAMPEAAKLAGVLGWLREASDASATPSDDALRRLMARVSVELDGELDAAVREPVRLAPTSDFDFSDPRSDSFNVRRERGWSASRIVLAAAVLLAVGFFAMSVTQAGPQTAALNEAAAVSSTDELFELAPRLDALVGAALLDIQTVSSDELADVHLLSRLAVNAPSEDALAAAKFLARRRSRAMFSLARRIAPPSSSVGLPWENVALAETAEPLGTTPDRRLHSAIENRDFSQVEAFCAGRDDLRGRLLEIWAAIGAGRNDDALAKLTALEAPGEPALPEAARVYLAGAFRDVGRPREALKRFELLTSAVPAIAFHIGALHKFDLFDEAKAGEWFGRLTGALSSYADLGLSLTHTAPLWRDDFHDLGWTPSVVDPARRVEAQPTRDGTLQFLAWQNVADDLHAGTLTAGDLEWSDYQVAVGVRFRDPESFGRRPGVRLFAGWTSADQNYHVALHRDGLAIGRCEPTALGSRTDVWPAQGEPSLAPSPSYPLDAGRWYTLKLRFQRAGSGAIVAAKVWPRDSAEPAGWAIVVTDHSPGASVRGRIGLSAIDCRADFSDLRVDSLNPPSE